VGDREREIEMAHRAVALNPNSFTAWFAMGWACLFARQPEEAVRSFERAIRLSPVDPMQPRAFVGMGLAFIELGRFDEAIVVGKKARRQISHSAVYRCLASAFAHLGRDVEAQEAVARLLELEPTSTISALVARAATPDLPLYIEGLRKAGLPE